MRKKMVMGLSKISMFACVIVFTGTAVLSSGCSQSKLEFGYDIYENDYSATSTSTTAKDIAVSFAADLCVADSENILSKNVNQSEDTVGGLFNLSTDEVLYSKEIFIKKYPASTTKILTALLAIEQGDLSKTITVSKNAVSVPSDSSTCGLKEGDTLTLEQALHGLLLCSGNDAAVAIAESIAGSEEEFVKMMNEKAAQLGATNSHFMNPYGYHDEEHYTTVYDMYLIFKEAIKLDAFIDIVHTASYTASYTAKDGSATNVVWNNTNGYLSGKYEQPDGITVVGGKTGTTSLAGACLVLLSEDSKGEPLVSIVFKADTHEILYEDMTDILEVIAKQ